MEGKTLAEALCEAQKAMQNPKKDKTAKVRTRTGGEYAYRYTTLDAVLDIVRPALNGAGVFLTQYTSNQEGTLLLHTRVMYGTEQSELDVTPYQYDTDPQEFGKRETYARRYSLLKAFGLAGDEDTDGDTGPQRLPQRAQAAKDAMQAARRKRMLARCAQLSAKLIENGVKAGAPEAYMRAQFGTDEMASLTDEQLLEYGKYLAQMEQDSSEKGE